MLYKIIAALLFIPLLVLGLLAFADPAFCVPAIGVGVVAALAALASGQHDRRQREAEHWRRVEDAARERRDG